MKAEWKKNQYGGWCLMVGNAVCAAMYQDAHTKNYNSYLYVGSVSAPLSVNELPPHPGPFLSAQNAVWQAVLDRQREIVTALEQKESR